MAIDERHLMIEARRGTRVVVGGRVLRFFGGCDYLGLSRDPRVLEALGEGVRRYGLSGSASPLTSGYTDAHAALEAMLAEWLGGEAAVVLASGYLANMALLQALRPAYAVMDEGTHSSWRDAARASETRTLLFGHVDAADARRAWAEAPEHSALVTDGAFARSGLASDLQGLVEIVGGRGSLIVDDAHGTGVLGDSGAGSCEAAGMDAGRVIVATTLAKGIGCAGGAVIGPAEVVDRVRRTAGAYAGTTALPPAVAAAARRAVEIARHETERRERLRSNAAIVAEALGLSSCLPAFSFVLEPAPVMERVGRDLLEAGVLVPLIDYPRGTGLHFRLVVASEHEADDVAGACEAVIACAGRHGARVVPAA